MKKTFSSFIVLTTALLTVLVLGSCDNKKFHLNGTISEAKDSVLYLENISLDGPVMVDSVKLGANGNFSFSGKAPEAPDFYRLRIARQIINISVDSTETITIKAALPNMATGYTVEGSEECDIIKELTLKQMDLQSQIISIQRDNTLSFRATRDSIAMTVERYKEEIKNNYIYKAPMRPSSYFALFQTIGNTLIFNPMENESDVKVFGAVATSWDTYHPHAVRGQNLHNITIEGMKNVRILRNKRMSQEIEAEKINMSNLIDISLADNNGNVRSLTDLKGKVVMLDFHVFGSNESPKRIMQMRDIYNKYHSQGLEIYQVSLDADEHFWKTQTAALPWICVRDPNGINSSNIVAYNVQRIPTFFLINRNNEVQLRDSQIEDLNAEIEKLLK